MTNVARTPGAMMRRALLAAVIGCVALAAMAACASPSSRTPSDAVAAQAAASRPMPVPSIAEPDSLSLDRARYVSQVMEKIKGREQQRAESVFSNLKMFRGMPAGRLVRIMDQGFARSLGVSCSHCHVLGEWDREDKPQKQIARDMSEMVGRINNELLKGIPNLKGAPPVPPTVNCTTCHRGSVKPALNLPG